MIYQCMNCGETFESESEAILAAESGCPNCGSTYIELKPSDSGNCKSNVKRGI